MPRLRGSTAVVLVFLSAASAVACMWDYDTLKMERAKFPGALELITGKFLRHSKEFYQWRIDDRLKRLAGGEEAPGLYDDLAVAYHKTGRSKEAIETILEKDRKHPGLYETEANLSVFYTLDGDLENGLKHVDRALAINPNAHFGREKYQKLLIEFLLERKAAASAGDRASKNKWFSFGYHLRSTERINFKEGDREEAVTAVLGMMRFADYDSVLLLDALGSVIGNESGFARDEDAKRLAARAYLKASYETDDPAEKETLRAKAKTVLTMQVRYPSTQTPIRLETLETDFQAELAEADLWYAGLREREIGWINSGVNPETEFDRLYEEEPVVVSTERAMTIMEWLTDEGTLQGSLLAAPFAVVFFCLVYSFRRRLFSKSAPTAV
ncbi:MAG: hypothetical protein ACRC1K_18495 [Planctomycetia bacterium]